MLEKLKIEGKNKDEMLEQFLDMNSLTMDDIYVKEFETEAKLFKSKKVCLEILKKEDIKKYIKLYFKTLSSEMGFDIQVEIREKDENFFVQLFSDNNAILIGKDGKNLNAIQLLLHQAINNQSGLNIHVYVDTSNYKDKRIKRIEREVKNIAREVLESKIEVKLDSMNSYERRVVHTIISEYDKLETESFGENPNRYVVIRYRED